MKQRELFPGGPRLSILGFGAWKAGGSWIYGLGQVDDATSIATMRTAFEGGVNWVDTAPIYGQGRSEEIVGQVLQDFPDVLVNTKCGHFLAADGKSTCVDLSPGAIRRDCEGSLKRLQRDVIDLYQFHIPAAGSMGEGWETMRELQREGKVRWIGSCNVSTQELASLNGAQVTEGVLNLLHRGLARDVAPWAAQHAIGVLVYETQVTGLLTGAFSAERLQHLSSDDYRHRAVDFQPEVLARALELVEDLRPIARELNLQVGELAISYACSFHGITGAMVGASSPDQVRGWLRAGEVELPDELHTRLTELASRHGFTPEADDAYARVLDSIKHA